MVEIKLGVITKYQNGEYTMEPLYSRIISLKTENNDLIYDVPGGLIGVRLKLEPF